MHQDVGLKPMQPFKAIRNYGFKRLPETLKRNGIGCYNHKAKSFWELANSNLNLKTCLPSDLEEIHGIGLKTSRCFVLHSRRNARYAGLDTHLLKFLADKGYEVPKSTPAKKEYLRLEQIFVKLADEAGMSSADFDLMLWRKYSGR